MRFEAVHSPRGEGDDKPIQEMNDVEGVGRKLALLGMQEATPWYGQPIEVVSDLKDCLEQSVEKEDCASRKGDPRERANDWSIIEARKVEGQAEGGDEKCDFHGNLHATEAGKNCVNGKRSPVNHLETPEAAKSQPGYFDEAIRNHQADDKPPISDGNICFARCSNNRSRTKAYDEPQSICNRREKRQVAIGISDGNKPDAPEEHWAQREAGRTQAEACEIKRSCRVVVLDGFLHRRAAFGAAGIWRQAAEVVAAAGAGEVGGDGGLGSDGHAGIVRRLAPPS